MVPQSGSDTDATKECIKALKELQALAVKSRTKASPHCLLNASQKATTWKRALVSALPLQATKGPDTRKRQHWPPVRSVSNKVFGTLPDSEAPALPQASALAAAAGRPQGEESERQGL